jgi:HAD superfamily hydrolase (TIGR01509 family)
MTIKAIVFDLDGVLFDGIAVHSGALNKALGTVDAKYVISSQDMARYNGLPTRTKLQRLTEERGLPEDTHDRIWNHKQALVSEHIRGVVKDEEKIHVLKNLKERGYKIAVASNSIRATVETVLMQKGLAEYIDFYVSNEDVGNPKPHPEIYARCLDAFGIVPSECIIIEDSYVGKQAANASGCHVLPVRCPKDVVLSRILHYSTYINNGGDTRKIHVVIPMAGLGSRFANAGYTLPKPLIPVNGKPMIQVVVENININARYIFIAMEEHAQEYTFDEIVREVTCDNYVLKTIDKVTDGSACTVLTIRDMIDNDAPLILANSDQYLEWDPYEFLVKSLEVDGLISCFEADHPKWSYARVDDTGRVTEVAEKRVISNLATTGIYYFSKGSQFVRCADSMISKNIRTNGEFYNCPIYNEIIAEGGNVGVHMCDRMWGIGVPGDLDVFLKHHSN